MFLLGAVLVLSVVTAGAFTATAGLHAAEDPNTDGTELGERSGVVLPTDTETVVSEKLAERDKTAVALLLVERDISDSAVIAGQVDATALRADSEATLGPVVEAASAMEGVTVRNTFWVGNVVSARVDLETVDPVDLAAIDGVTRVAPNTEMTRPSSVQAQTESNVSADQTQNFTYGLRQIDVPGFEDKYSASGEGTTVTIIDNGISDPEAGHPDLEFGIKAVAENGSVTTGTLGQPTEQAHGEHTAGTATGAADPAGDVPRYGVAPNASLINIKVGERKSIAVEDLLASVEFAVEQDSDVASMSLGLPIESPGDSVLELLMGQQAQTALAAGTVVIGTTSNEGAGDAGGPVRTPGAEFSVLSVGASNEARDIADLSSGAVIDRFSVDYNTSAGGAAEYPEFYPRQYVKPDVSAPGIGVLSSGPLGGDLGDPAATYSRSSGTSMAAPHVAGAVALIQSATDGETPAPLIRNALAETAEKPDTEFPSRYGRDIRYGTGIINVTAATDAIVDGSLTVEGKVTDSDGDPVVGAVVTSEAGALTSTDQSGSYTLHTTSDPANVTLRGLGVESRTRLVADDTDPVNFRNASTVSVDVLDGQPAAVAFGGSLDVSVDVANLEALTVDLTAESTVAPEDVTVTLDGDELPLGESVALDETVDGQVMLGVDLASGGSYTEGDVLGIRHTFEGVGDSVVVETGPTELTETPAPAEYEVSNLSAPAETTAGTSVPISFEITNVGQQTPDSHGYVIDPFGETTELNVEPGETRLVSVSVSGTRNRYSVGDVAAYEIRVGQLEEGFTGLRLESVEDSVTAELALQAGGTRFDITGLDAPPTADPGQRIDVTATVENIGELGDTQTVELAFDGGVVANESVTLDAFTLANGVDNTTVTFSDIPLPDTEAYFEYGVSTRDDSVGMPIAVGLTFQNVTVTQNRDTEGELTAELLRESLPPRYGVPTVVDAGRVNSSVVEKTDVFVFHDLGDAASDIVPAVEDDPLTNAVYLEQSASSNAITGRAAVLNDPEAVESGVLGPPPVAFTIEQDHPIFDGVGSAGDVVPIHSGGNAGFVWFENASGETLATADNQNTTDDNFGPSVAVDPDSGAVLLSTIATSVLITPDNFTAEASQILANAVAFAEPDDLEEPFLQVSNLSAPAEASTGEQMDVTATVANLGNQTGTQTVEAVFDGSVVATTTVTLDASEQTTVEFDGIALPGQIGAYEHGVATDNNSQTAEILVGDLTTVTIVESGFRNTFGDDIELLLAGTLPDTFDTQIVNANNVTDTTIDNTDIFLFNDAAQFIDGVEADATTGAVYLDQRGIGSGAIPTRSSAIGDPAETFRSFQGSSPVEYTIQQDHPIFDGIGGPGDTVEIHDSFTPDVSWFSGASGETLAAVQAGTVGGPAVAVDPDSGSVLLSSLGVTQSVGPEEYTPEATQILANGVEFAKPPDISGAFFDVTGLTAPAETDAGATLNVSATVTNVGNESGTQTVEFAVDGSVVTTVPGLELDPGNETTVEFTDVSLPGDGGVFEHGIQTANDSQTAEIQAGSPDIELVELTQPDELTLEQEFTTEVTLRNNGTVPYEGELLQVTNLNDTASDTGAVPLNRTTVRLAPGENETVTGAALTFAEFNAMLDAGLAPGDDVRTGYRRGQNLGPDAPGDPLVEAVYSEPISIVPVGPPDVTVSTLRIAGQGANATAVVGSYDVTAQITHSGGASGDVPVELTVGDETLSKNVSLGTNQTVTVTFENATSSLVPGSYNVTMSGSTDAVSGTLTLSMNAGDGGDDGTTGGDGGDDGTTGGDGGDDGTTGGDGGDDGTTGGDGGDAGDDNATDDGGDGSGPGFGPIVVLAGLGGAGYLLKRRGRTDGTDSS